MIQFHRYSEVDAERQAAIDARMYLWNRMTEDEILKRLPDELPKNWFYQQEIVSCLGRSTAHKKYDLDEEHYQLCLGFQSRTEYLTNKYIAREEVYYQPRNSGLFSVIENIIVADFHAKKNGKKLVLVGEGGWWNYDEEFSAIFPYEVRYGNRPTISFEKMRDEIFYADIETMTKFHTFKRSSYVEIYKAICKFTEAEEWPLPCIFFFRGGDKLLTETILPPDDIILADLKAVSRREDRRYITSDDYDLANKIMGMDKDLINLTTSKQHGYHHVAGQKVSCLPILKNYILLVNAEETIACPSANLVNAAFWSRSDKFIYPTSNPVYRYALI